jgi:hypothetical protein
MLSPGGRVVQSSACWRSITDYPYHFFPILRIMRPEISLKTGDSL